MPVAEQCAWALGNVAGEGKELREVLLSQGALPPLARMMLPNKGSTVRTAAWALSNLIKVLNPSSDIALVSCHGYCLLSLFCSFRNNFFVIVGNLFGWLLICDMKVIESLFLCVSFVYVACLLPTSEVSF